MNGTARSVQIPVKFLFPRSRFLVRASIRTRVCRACCFFHMFCYSRPSKSKQVKLRIFLIKLSHSSSTYENTFAFQHFIDRRRTIIFGLKERAIPFAYSVRTVLGSSHSSSVIWRLFNVLTPSLYSVRCLTVLVLLSFVLKLTTPIGFD